MSGNGKGVSPAVRVEVVGTVTDQERGYVVEKMGSLTHYASIRSAHVVVDEVSHDGGAVTVRVNLSGDRVLAHAEADGATTPEAVDIVRQRLYRQLTRHHGHAH